MLAVAIFAVAAIALGCAKTSGRSVDAEKSFVSPHLVMPSSQYFDLSLAENGDAAAADDWWLLARNDAHLGGFPGDDLAQVQFVEVRHREFLRVINGRPRDYSTTQTWSMKRGVAP